MKPPVDPGIYLLADHLDAALAAGEDLLAAELAAPADIDRAEPGASTHAIAVFVNTLKRLEAALAARILQARRRAAELPRQEPLVRGVIDLFQSSTASALALVEHFSRLHEGTTFDPSNLTPYAVLRSRGLLAPDAAELPPFERVVVTEAYLIGGVLPLGEVLNVVATTLDTLDTHFDLYLDSAALTAGVSLETGGVTIHDPAVLFEMDAEVGAASALPDAATPVSPDTVAGGDVAVSSNAAPERDTGSMAPSTSSSTTEARIEAAAITGSAAPASASAHSELMPASTKPAEATPSKSGEPDALGSSSAAKAPGNSSTGASSADASPQATAEPATAPSATARAEPTAVAVTAPSIEAPAPSPKAASAAVSSATPRGEAKRDAASNATAAGKSAVATGELKSSAPAPAGTSGAAAASIDEHKGAEASGKTAAAGQPPREQTSASRGAPQDKEIPGGRADKTLKPSLAADAVQPKPGKKPMTLLEALAALDKNRPSTPPSG